MATMTKSAGGSKAATAKAPMDQKAKIKVIAASSLLLIAVVWIAYYLTASGGTPEVPVVSQEEAAQIETTHKEELKKVTEETNAAYRGGKPPAKPSGS